MGAVPSRQRYHDVAYQALRAAQDLRREVGGPQVRGAIMAYIDGRIDAERLIRECTHLEANEFARLAHSVYHDWVLRHEHQFRCVVDTERGACAHPRENLHFEYCAHFRPLPPNIEVPFELRRGRPGYRSQGGEQVGGRHHGATISAEYGNQVFGNDYGDYPARATRGRDAQARHHDSDFGVQYSERFDNRRGQSFNANRADQNRGMYPHYRGSGLNNNDDGLNDESEIHNSRSYYSWRSTRWSNNCRDR